MTSEILELEQPDCLERLRAGGVGRIGFVDDTGPLVLPINYRFVERNGPHWLMFRTGERTQLAQTVDATACFEIDGTDDGRQRGWSVIARGKLMQLDDDEVEYLRDHFDPGPWIENRTAWLLLRCDSISGREIAGIDEWPFDDRAYR